MAGRTAPTPTVSEPRRPFHSTSRPGIARRRLDGKGAPGVPLGKPSGTRACSTPAEGSTAGILPAWLTPSPTPPEPWTAGRLREALKDLADDAPIYIGVASDPGDFNGYHDRVLAAYEPVELHWPAADGEPERTEVQHTLFADWPAGTYDVLD
ncbi:DUF6225 family protein [Streptomyces sp. Ac-502]|uniref:DUF6225 family protein n=1 Tax=Streptomyces sp. Ac-502 TaxID=3342801 RepID=UPI0038622111